MCVQHGGQAIGAQTHLGTERGRSPADWRGETNVVAQLAATGGALAGQVWGSGKERVWSFTTARAGLPKPPSCEPFRTPPARVRPVCSGPVSGIPTWEDEQQTCPGRDRDRSIDRSTRNDRSRSPTRSAKSMARQGSEGAGRHRFHVFPQFHVFTQFREHNDHR